MSPGLRRARQPFLLRNALTGVVLTGFAVGVWAYSIGAVKQEDFADIDEEARTLGRVGTQAAEGAKQTTVKAAAFPIAREESNTTPLTLASPVPAVVETASSKDAATGQPRGVVAGMLWERYPGLLDPKTKTLVWGAPPVDKIGRVGDSTPSSRK